MHLWVQPVDEVTSENAVGDEIPIVDSESDVPIVQLDVHVRHYLRKKLITDPKAAFNSLKPCESFNDVRRYVSHILRDAPLDDLPIWAEPRADQEESCCREVQGVSPINLS